MGSSQTCHDTRSRPSSRGWIPLPRLFPLPSFSTPLLSTLLRPLLFKSKGVPRQPRTRTRARKTINQTFHCVDGRSFHPSPACTQGHAPGDHPSHGSRSDPENAIHGTLLPFDPDPLFRFQKGFRSLFSMTDRGPEVQSQHGTPVVLPSVPLPLRFF